MSTNCSCGKKSTGLECGLCKDSLCKPCTQFVDPDQFSFMPKVPTELTHLAYCYPCFINSVQPQIQNYEKTIELAKNINVYEKHQGKETRFLSRKEKTVTINECSDRQEAMLRLAFLAAQLGYNAIIDVNIVGKKLTNGTYQTTVYSGTGVPSTVQAHKIAKDRSLWQNPN